VQAMPPSVLMLVYRACSVLFYYCLIRGLLLSYRHHFTYATVMMCVWLQI
jgi:hypothetical protein